MLTKSTIVNELRLCPVADIKKTLLAFIEEFRTCQISDFDRLLGSLQEEARNMAEEDVEAACLIAVKVWSKVEEDKYYFLEISIPETREQLIEFLKKHEEYADLKDRIAELLEKAENIEEEDHKEVWEIACEMEHIMQEYFHSEIIPEFMPEEGIEIITHD